MKSYIFHAEQQFIPETDYFHLRGQVNILRYLPIGSVVVRLHPDDSLFDALAKIAAVKVTECKLRLSIPKGLNNTINQFLHASKGRHLIGNNPLFYEADIALIESISKLDRIRYAASDREATKVFEAAAQTEFYIARTPVMMEGRIELLQYYRQKSVCTNHHRYGNLGERALQYEAI